MSLFNYMALVQYDGTKYQGWQRQEKNDKTIQYKIEKILSKYSGEDITINGSGRTDSGVHARGQVINFKIGKDVEIEELKEYLNTYLPEDIMVVSIRRVSDRFHARLNAKGKKYIYYIDNAKQINIFTRRYSYHIDERLDIDKMNMAAESMLGTHDFTSFTSKKNTKKSCVRTIESIEITREDKEVRIEFVGDGFLYHMVRIIVGTLVEVGLGKRMVNDIEGLIEAKDRAKAGYLVPAQGLFLEEVYY